MRTHQVPNHHPTGDTYFIFTPYRQQSAWILTRDRQANATTIGLAKQAFQDNNIDQGSLKLFKMRQDDNCVNDKDGSCSEDNDNLRPKD